MAQEKEMDDDEFDRMLQNFIDKELSDVDCEIEETEKLIKDDKPLPEEISEQDEFLVNLYAEEKALYEAYSNYVKGITALAQSYNLPQPEFSLDIQNLYVRYKPYVGQIIKADTLNGWDTMISAVPQKISQLPDFPTDEELLNFAENEADTNLQLCIISYVEILLELESCEIAYEERLYKAKRKRVERKIYEEHMNRQKRMKKYIEAIKAKNFPIDAERLITNYFKTARQDPDGAYQILINNPATYAPIEINKIKPRFFGLIKPRPQDGIKINHKLGKFLKKLKA